jgi:predicted GNAT family N-acyltransferase
MLQTSLVDSGHRTEKFDCGVPDLDDFIKNRAVEAGNLGVCRTYVLVLPNGQVVGYYTLSAWLIGIKEATPGILDGIIETHSMPAILLGKLAVDKQSQDLGLSKILIRDAIEKTFTTAESVGVRAMALHAMTDRLVKTYGTYGFLPSSNAKKPHYLMASLNQLRAAMP